MYPDLLDKIKKLKVKEINTPLYASIFWLASRHQIDVKLLQELINSTKGKESVKFIESNSNISYCTADVDLLIKQTQKYV